MFAVGLTRDKKGVCDFEIPEPEIRRDKDVLVKIKQVGIDGTDFNMIEHDVKDIAVDRNEITLGHEMIGVVKEIGSGVEELQPGDTVTMTVRRGCNRCSPCLHNRSDMCMTGLYAERGIHKLDGFLTEYAVDEERYIVKVPKGLEDVAVLTEPLSIAEKAIEQIRLIQRRMPWGCSHPEHAYNQENWGRCKVGLVIGAGTLGFLGTCLLALAGLNIYVASRTDEQRYKVKLVKELGAQYINTTHKTPKDIVDLCSESGNIDLIFEASGASELAVNMIPHMSRSSIYVMTGIPRGEMHVRIDSHQLLRQIVRYNQVIVGSVNSNRKHFEMALRDMAWINQQYTGILSKALTHRFKLKDYKKAFELNDPDALKIVVEM